MELKASGHLAKMDVKLDDTVSYQLPLDDERVALNGLIGEHISI